MTRWVFYVGGPQAVPYKTTWTTPWEGEVSFKYGCEIVREMGAEIPPDTYDKADPQVSQVEWEDRGLNTTALLPLEEP